MCNFNKILIDKIDKISTNALLETSCKEITYRNKMYDLETNRDDISKFNFSIKKNLCIGGCSISICNGEDVEISHITIHFKYREYFGGNIKIPYLMHIHRLRTADEYRNKGFATYLMCVSLIIAQKLKIKEVTVINHCSFKEYYSLFKYKGKSIREIQYK